MSLSHNIPFLSIMLTLVSGILVPLIRREGGALRLIRGVQLGVAGLSALLLVRLSGAGASFSYPMGHIPAPWGNELRAGPLEALLALTFSVVMLLSLSGGAEDLRRDVRPDRQGWYCLLMQLLFGALLAMVYTDDLFTGYVFVEIAAVTACIAVAAKESGRSVVAAIRYLIFSCLGSGLVLLGIAMLYCITGQLLFSGLEEAVARLVPLGGAAFTVGGLSLCGLPLLAGFSAKYCIAAAALDAEWQTAPALFGLAASSVLNAMYYIPAILAIWGRARANEDAPLVWMRGNGEGKCAILLFLAGNLLLGTAFGPVRGLIQQGLSLF